MELTVNGRTAYCYTGGRPFDARLPAVVFIHGAQNDHSVWGLQSRYFAHHGRTVLVPDLPGHGRSPGPVLTSVEAMADWLVALLDAAGVARASLVGHSMGSLISLDAAARHPQRVAHIALIGSAVPMPVSEVLLEAARSEEARAENMVNIWSHGPRGHLGGSTVPGLWLIGVNRRLMERAAPGVLFNDLNACNAYSAGTEAAARVGCPALVIAGSRDQMTPAKAAKALAETIPGARLVTIEGCGHSLLAEFPDAVLDALRGFLLK
ncbi:MAG: alpha/beta hydrolase [Pseudomonadota bacterium]|jgi:pimeloyl-ACP methyl ester carboxylesterase